ncbi:MAG: tetratricopeptide repeat protein, partial [Deltaproteobacteria bacterium]
ADLLNLCAFLAPDDIPKELLDKGVSHLPESLAAAVQDSLAFDDALAVHRLVQAVVRDRLDEAGRKQWAGVAVELVNASLSADVDTNMEVWPWYSRLLPQALAAAGHAETVKTGLPAAGRVFNQCGFYMQIRAEFAGAQACYERALAICRQFLGEDHPHTQLVKRNLAALDLPEN